MGRIIEVVEYNPQWPVIFTEEADHLKKLIPSNLIVAVHHIGSTAVPNLAAKPVVDLLLVVSDLDQFSDYESALVGIGYESLGEYGIKGRRFFQKGGDLRTHHLHVYCFNAVSEIGRHLALKKFLLAHPEVAAEYGKIKMEAAANNRKSIEGYMEHKDHFVKKIEKQALKSLWENWK